MSDEIKIGQQRKDTYSSGTYTITGKTVSGLWNVEWDTQPDKDIEPGPYRDSQIINDPVIRQAPVADPAISPDHYKGLGTFEAIDVIEAFQLNYRLGNVIKYVLRADKKGKAVQDLKKAIWYLTREVARREGK